MVSILLLNAVNSLIRHLLATFKCLTSLFFIYLNLFFIIDALWKPMNEVDVKTNIQVCFKQWHIISYTIFYKTS